MILLLILYFCSSGQKILEYKFWKKYGQIIYDYSLNGNHATNGNRLGNDLDDSLFTDRGLFIENKSFIKLPPNDLTTSFPLSQPFTLLFWISMSDNFWQIFGRTCTEYGLNWYRLDINSLKLGYISDQEISSQYPQTILACISYIDNWVMISYTISQNVLILRVNDNAHYTFAFFDSLDLSSECSSMSIGYYILGSLQFYMWNFVIISNENEYSKYFEPIQTSSCFIGTCSCNFAMKLDDLGVGCVSESIDVTKNSLGNACSQIPCRGNYKINCLCSSNS